MIFTETPLKGAFVIDIERRVDERGFFARCWCAKEFELNGLSSRLVQCNTSFTARAGTLRGMHYQTKPFEEAKLIRCIRGSIYDVIVDIRPESPTFTSWFGITLSADNRKAVFAPEGFAHGFVTLEDDVEVFYQMSEYYSPEHAAGFRWNDPLFQIEWPLTPGIMSERDRTYPDFSPQQVRK
jgi:dTDP-4-dehydrorhamnose 3,5-epimerase